MNFLKIINEGSEGELGFFVFRAFLNGDKIDFECLLKPEFKTKEKKPRAITQTSGIQFDYWTVYSEVCDEMGLGDFQVQPASQHYQNIPIGVKGAYTQTSFFTTGSVSSILPAGALKNVYPVPVLLMVYPHRVASEGS